MRTYEHIYEENKVLKQQLFEQKMFENTLRFVIENQDKDYKKLIEKIRDFKGDK